MYHIEKVIERKHILVKTFTHQRDTDLILNLLEYVVQCYYWTENILAYIQVADHLYSQVVW